MTRLKSIPFAIAGLVVLAGTAAAFAALPEASNHGIQTATDASGKSVPVRAAPADAPAVQAPGIEAPAGDPAGGPPAGTHGLEVSTVAKADDTTPDTNHGADVSAVARDNAGQAIAKTHRPAGAGKPADPGKPAYPGKPADPQHP
jgi:hypothetical protein